MADSEIPELENLTLRVLEEYDEERKTFVAKNLHPRRLGRTSIGLVSGERAVF